MKLSRTLTLIFFLLCVVPLLLAGIISHYIFLNNVRDFERAQLAKYQTTVWAYLKNSADFMISIGKDYCEWDEMYFAVKSDDIQWLDKNAVDFLPETYSLDTVVVINSADRIISSTGDSKFLGADMSKSVLVQKAKRGQKISVVIKSKIGPQLVTAYPILRSTGVGKPDGVLIIGRKIGQGLLSNLQYYADGNWRFYYSDTDFQKINDNYNDTALL